MSAATGDHQRSGTVKRRRWGGLRQQWKLLGLFEIDQQHEFYSLTCMMKEGLASATQKTIDNAPPNNLSDDDFRSEVTHIHQDFTMETFAGPVFASLRGSLGLTEQDVFYPDDRINARYDIKGCEVSRWTEPAPEGSQIIVVFKDLNFEGQYIILDRQRPWLLRQVEIDTHFLRRLNVLDYSLLLAHQPLHHDERHPSLSFATLIMRTKKSVNPGTSPVHSGIAAVPGEVPEDDFTLLLSEIEGGCLRQSQNETDYTLKLLMLQTLCTISQQLYGTLSLLIQLLHMPYVCEEWERTSQFADTLTEIRPATMGQKQMGHTLPAEATCEDSMIDMGQDRSGLILIKHCRDMKQQEICLRLITLFLLLICTALFIFMNGAILRQRGNSGSNGQESTAERSPYYSKQCPADNPSKNSERLRIHLRSMPIVNASSKGYMKWDVEFGEKYNKEKDAIMIPKTDYYFVYVKITLKCHKLEENDKFQKFGLSLLKWSEGYTQAVPLTHAWDGIFCTVGGFRSLFVGQLFDLWEGDQVSVWIEEGYELISRSSFGAYLA
ncbi:Phosphatidylinositol 4-phosphate 5-kinase-like protein 1 [Nibea albiflora]|uniref:Phosphatidylinositol 4-phosphate 5-kinase-like protein 1 n=1 Tax=Nibea albiflora TaxID=240163 RepID=A0ACB7F9W6_NIBAL|nr:Phosphatidylinositol 4-phosphate 5-kinase-like protein 1 [Nibea albiflora]